jgi:hypothetical protein
MKLNEQKTIKILTPLSASSNAHRLLSISKEEKLLLHRSWGCKKETEQQRSEVANREIFASMSPSAFLPSLCWIHSYAGIYQQILQLYGFYQVWIPAETNNENEWLVQKIQVKLVRTIIENNTPYEASITDLHVMITFPCFANQLTT